jgi:hypothetical protein
MQISESQLDRESLARFGEEAAALLRAGDFVTLAERFGYALAYGREPAKAMAEDLAASLSESRESSESAVPFMTIKYFHADAAENAGLLAVVECVTQVASGSAVLLALVVTARGPERHITLEGISGVGWVSAA